MNVGHNIENCYSNSHGDCITLFPLKILALGAHLNGIYP